MPRKEKLRRELTALLGQQRKDMIQNYIQRENCFKEMDAILRNLARLKADQNPFFDDYVKDFEKLQGKVEQMNQLHLSYESAIQQTERALKELGHMYKMWKKEYPAKSRRVTPTPVQCEACGGRHTIDNCSMW